MIRGNGLISLEGSGRRRPIPIEKSQFLADADTVVVAIGQRPNTLGVHGEEAVQITKRGTLVVNPETQETALESVYAGGDIVTGNATVISAMGAGKKAAHHIYTYLTKH